MCEQKIIVKHQSYAICIKTIKVRTLNLLDATIFKRCQCNSQQYIMFSYFLYIVLYTL